jgi:hypothetical protein
MTMKCDNVYSRLQGARVELQSRQLKETGKNSFAGYTYLDLSDFLPHINEICAQYGLCGVISFGDVATLTIINTEKPDEQIVFSSPMSTAELKGCHPIQNLGAVQSYLRRYLWLSAFEIVEHDALDATTGNDKTPTPKKPESKNDPVKPALSTDQEKYFPRIRAALQTIQGDDLHGKKQIIKSLTSFTGDGGNEVEGIEDYRKLDGKRLQILAHKLEEIVKKREAEQNAVS